MPARARPNADDQPETPIPVDDTQLVGLAASIVSAYVARNHVPAADIPVAMRSIHQALADLNGGNGKASSGVLTPAVSIKKSVTDSHIICLEDGKPLKMLKRYLRSHHNLTPEAYRAKWNLPHDYPMVAPAYARVRSAFAKSFGLGRVPDNAVRGRRKRKAA
ncbi:MAG: MucR family transcriptional regulator [Alphaproteobacteria bacterium]|jgi:predicted transcriptional regulator|nr:MucR family transcriptional regulator [Alphaproteobacteria bacterium]